ncbi:hypothetical protein AMTR_s00029p00101730 [Amborella trichopoda]|uniref:Uncharacterized protein n=1 Tax=Amborella trichopoda TaxID=13333 RepID=W1PQH0_AMBTC|nr:hypothetical protein AMTR_s00029p00101730 [Amborella trichopoda]
MSHTVRLVKQDQGPLIGEKAANKRSTPSFRGPDMEHAQVLLKGAKRANHFFLKLIMPTTSSFGENRNKQNIYQGQNPGDDTSTFEPEPKHTSFQLLECSTSLSTLDTFLEPRLVLEP